MGCAGCDDCKLMSKEPFYEVHVTVDIKPEEFKAFEVACENDLATALRICNVHNINGGGTDDYFTKSSVKGTYQDALNEMYRVAFILKKAGFNTIRHKIEAAPWVSNFHSQYYEAHMEFQEVDDFSSLYLLCNLLDGHISYNAKKRRTYLVTFRKNDLSLKEFEQYVENKQKILTVAFQHNKTIFEKAVYDDNENHDAKWLNKK